MTMSDNIVEEEVVMKGESTATGEEESAEDKANSLGIPTAEFVVSISLLFVQ